MCFYCFVCRTVSLVAAKEKNFFFYYEESSSPSSFSQLCVLSGWVVLSLFFFWLVYAYNLGRAVVFSSKEKRRALFSAPCADVCWNKGRVYVKVRWKQQSAYISWVYMRTAIKDSFYVSQSSFFLSFVCVYTRQTVECRGAVLMICSIAPLN